MEKQFDAQDDQVKEVPNGVKTILLPIGSSVLLGAIFWAGATYNRVSAIEVRLANMETQLQRIGDISTIAERTADTQRRLDKLEDAERKR